MVFECGRYTKTLWLVVIVSSIHRMMLQWRDTNISRIIVYTLVSVPILVFQISHLKQMLCVASHKFLDVYLINAGKERVVIRDNLALIYMIKMVCWMTSS